MNMQTQSTLLILDMGAAAHHQTLLIGGKELPYYSPTAGGFRTDQATAILS